jgi:hypothetical protein
MTGNTTIIAAGLLGLASMSAPSVERTVPFKVGEKLTYDVAWSSYVTAGTAVTEVQSKQPTPHSIAYHIVADGRPVPFVERLYALHYHLDALLDAYSLLPDRATVDIEEGSRKRTRTKEFDRRVEPHALDALSAIYALRAAPLRPGVRMTWPVVENGVTYTVRLETSAPEQVRTSIGTMAAWKVTPSATDENHQPAGRNMAIWISTDVRRLPLKLQAELPVGTFDLVLRDVR